jgi:Flp pilus assembly protein TadG
MSNTKPTQSGVAAIEFSLSSLLWLPLMLGTLFYGAELIRDLQAVQLARDIASMYARNVDFSQTANKSYVARLGRELNLQVTGGSGVVILTTIQYISQNECNVLHGTGITCTNLLHWVVTQRNTIGDTSLRLSSYTSDPIPSTLLDPSSGKVLSNASPSYPLYLTDSRLQLNTNFNATGLTVQTNSSNLPVTDSSGLPVAYGAGTSVYVVEVYFKSTPVPGFRNNPGLYVVTIS